MRPAASRREERAAGYRRPAEAEEPGPRRQGVPAPELRTATMDMARRIATRPSFALRLAKESVNQTLEAQGQLTALKAAFSLQHLAHAHNRVRFGIPVDPGGLT